MKSMLCLLLIIPSLIKAQQKQPVYFKLSPSLLFEKGNDNIFGIFAGLDGKFGRYTTFGIGSGYFKLKDAKRPIIPLGIDLNLADFEKRKVSPVIILGAYYPIYEEKITGTSYSYKSSGKFLYQVGGGISINGAGSKKQKLFLTASFSQLTLSTNPRVSTIGAKKNETIELGILSMSFML